MKVSLTCGFLFKKKRLEEVVSPLNLKRVKKKEEAATGFNCELPLCLLAHILASELGALGRFLFLQVVLKRGAVFMTEMIRPCVLLCIAVLDAATGYRPVIIVHGLFDGPRQFTKLESFISQTHPGTSVTTVDLYDDMASLKPLWEQVEGFKKAMMPIMNRATDGVHLICFSQGGLICRGVLATVPKHNVHSQIFLSSPLAGQYGDTSYLKFVFPKYIKSRIYHLCYNHLGQKISICNFWKDPHQRVRYLKSSSYLAILNGESQHPNLTAWREHFLSIKKLVLIGGPDDGVITPWQSSFFGFYDSNEMVVEMKKQDWYLKDVFGLKTLDSRGDLVQCVFSGVRHTSWHLNFTVYKDCIEPWLT